MENEDGSSSQLPCSGSLRTRSQVAPDWTLQESLILVNEISAVEGDCLDTLSSFQKWKIVVENCKALEVNRSLNQCRRKWDSLLSDYKKIKQWESKRDAMADGESYWLLEHDDGRKKWLGLPESFNSELFKAIDGHFKEQGGRCDTDPDSDPEAEADPLLSAIAQSGSNKQRHMLIPQRRNTEESEKPKRSIKSEKIKGEECCSEEKVVEHLANNLDESRQEEKEQMMAAKLRENVQLINAIVKGHMPEDADYKMSDVLNVEAIQNDFMRCKGDKLVICLRNLADTLDQLCAMVQ